MIDITALEHVATGRTTSIFAADIRQHSDQLREALTGSSIAVIGAAGSIGFPVVKALLRYRLARLVLMDLNENGLVEVVRDLRSSVGLEVPDDFAELPIGLGSPECGLYFRETRRFDYIMNLSAMKHVRSEKDLYCLMRMIDTNVLFVDDFLGQLAWRCKKVFSVSSDKAVNPANVMGATKMVMEVVLDSHAERQPWSSARFANVAFSNGSLPFGFLMRIEKKQPLAAPTDIRRYFISHEEAAQLCVLSCALGENADVFFPRLQSVTERSFTEIATETLRVFGYEPYECSSELEAKAKAAELIHQKRWPCFFAPVKAEGEKHFEEFFGPEDVVDSRSYQEIGIVKPMATRRDFAALARFLEFAKRAKSTGGVSKEDYIQELRTIVPTFRPTTGTHLDRQM